MYDDYGQFIAGEWRRGSGPQSIAVCDPGNGQIIGQITAAAESDTQDALLSAGRGARNGGDGAGGRADDLPGKR